MRILLAMGVASSWVGDWHEVRGNERAVVVYPLGEGEKVRLEVEPRERGDAFSISLLAGPTLIQPKGWLRYRVVKDDDEAAEKMPTTIELIVVNDQERKR